MPSARSKNEYAPWFKAEVGSREKKLVDVRYARWVGDRGRSFCLDTGQSTLMLLGIRAKYLFLLLRNELGAVSRCAWKESIAFLSWRVSWRSILCNLLHFSGWQQPRLSGCSKIWHDGVVERTNNIYFYCAAGMKTDWIKVPFTAIWNHMKKSKEVIETPQWIKL